MVDHNTKALVIAPHSDDEVFGCGGTIKKLTDAGAYVQLAVAAVSSGERTNEMRRAMDVLGIHWSSIFSLELDALLDTISIRLVVDWIDTLLREMDYDYIFFPYPSHHQDHKIVHEATLAALRPGNLGKPPSHILMYEYTYPSWSRYNLPDGKFYVDITDTIDSKIDAIHQYASQVHKWPHPVSEDAAIALARVRGMAVGAHFAEMFYVVQIKGEI